MSADIWTQPSGYNLGTFNERTTINVPLPVSAPPGSLINFKVISGQLPRGLRLKDGSISGTPFEVPRETTSTFVIRAEYNYEVFDRTFNLTISGADQPQWVTEEGLLPVGGNNAFYIIDSSFIDFNLNAIDNDTAAGQQLTYFIASGDGELPPGLILLPNGRITGFIQPLLKTPETKDNGNYDVGLYDSVAYDFGIRPTNGYDSFLYSSFTYDFAVDTLYPRKLNRNYEFIATVTDGDTVIKRQFRIYVVGDDFFRADNVIMQAGEGTYTADASYVRAPIFTTPKYLGLRRADNYQTFKIDIFEGFFNELGPVFYELAPANALVNGVVQRDAPGDNIVGSKFLRFIKATDIPKVGYKVNFNQDFTGATNTTYTVTNVEILGGDFYRVELDIPLDVTIPNGSPIYLGPESRLPPGMQFDITTGEVFGVVPYQPAITETYTFTIKARRLGEFTQDEEGGTRFEFDTSRRMFTVDILGEVESAINWKTRSNLGVIDVGFPSTLFVNAETTYKNSTVFYTLEDGNLPPGLNLNLDGEIVGKVNQLRNQNTYRSYWKPGISYNKKDIVKKNVIYNPISVTRRKNTASLVTEQNNTFLEKSLVKIITTQLGFNYTEGIPISLDKFKIDSVASITGDGPYLVKFLLGTVVRKTYVSGAINDAFLRVDSISGLSVGMILEGTGFTRRQRIKKFTQRLVGGVLVDFIELTGRADPGSNPSGTITFSVPQNLEPLAPRYTLIKGTSSILEEFITPNPVTVKSTSGNGIGAQFLIRKASGITNEVFNYTNLIFDIDIRKDITVTNPGTGYQAGDTITISGEDLGGVDGVNDLTFTLVTGLDFKFRVNGNRNLSYNGEFQAVNSTSTYLTLLYDDTADAVLYDPILEEEETFLNVTLPLNYTYNNEGWDNLSNYFIRNFSTLEDILETLDNEEDILNENLIAFDEEDNNYYTIKFTSWNELTNSYSYIRRLIVDDPTITLGRSGNNRIEFEDVSEIKLGSEIVGRGILPGTTVTIIDKNTNIISISTLLSSKAGGEYRFKPTQFGPGLISQPTGLTSYEAQTQITSVNYFNYPNKGLNQLMTPTQGELIGEYVYYRAKVDNIPAGTPTTNTDFWEIYRFPEEEKTPTTFDNSLIFYDDEDTTFDRTYRFTIKARDVLGYSAIENNFSLTINIPENKFYSNITARPFLKPNQRTAFKEFINDSTVFDPKYIYRLGDKNFGIQKNLSTLIFAGIETKNVAEYVSAMGYNNKPKRFTLGEVKKAVAKTPGTNNIVYEVVYIDLIDPLEKNGKFLPYRVAHIPSNQLLTIDNTNEFYDGPFNVDNPYWKRPNPFYGSIDRTDIIAGDAGTGVKFPSSISIWRKRIREIPNATRERNYLPLWMRTIQPGSFTELDYTPSVVLCYCKPGGADEVLLNIKNSGFDFKLLDYTIDRYIIDAVEDYYQDRYLVFRNDRTTIA